MIIPDVNLLIYAYDTKSPNHTKAAKWWVECLSGKEQIGIPAVVIFGFVRVTAQASVFDTPLTVTGACKIIHSWLEQPCVSILDPGRSHVSTVLDLLERVGATGNLVTDGQIAALAIQYDGTIHSADADFYRFPAKWINPLSNATAPGTRRR